VLSLTVTGTHKRAAFTLTATANEVPPPVPGTLPYFIADRGYRSGPHDPIPGTLRVYLQTPGAPDGDPERGYRDGRQWFPEPVNLNGIPYRLRIELERVPGGTWRTVPGSERPVQIDRLAWWANSGAVVTWGASEPTDAARSWAWDLAREVLPAILAGMAADLVPLAVESLEAEALRRQATASELRHAADVIDEGARAAWAATK
jgi:hypothetical protein